MNKQRIMEIIAEEIGCPGLVEGTNPKFKYCGAIGQRIPQIDSFGRVSWKPAICYCEKAAARILELLKESSNAS